MNLSSLVQKHFDLLTEQYDHYSQKRAAYLKSQEDLVVHALGAEGKQNLTVLDAGCGSGSRGAAIGQRLSGSTLYGYDVSMEMVAVSKTKKYAATEQGTLARPPFGGVQFDAILCLFSVFSYLASGADRRAAVEGFWRGLKDDGLLCIDVTNRWHAGEGLRYRKSRFKIARELLYSLIRPGLSWGDVLFSASVDGRRVPGFFHTMIDGEFKGLFEGYFDIEKRYVIGYDTGRTYDDETKGNFLYVCRKKASK